MTDEDRSSWPRTCQQPTDETDQGRAPVGNGQSFADSASDAALAPGSTAVGGEAFFVLTRGALGARAFAGATSGAG